jgi:VWFA-related protein
MRRLPVLALVLAASAVATPQKVAPDQSSARFSATTQLVTVPVVVTKDGKHVAGLQRDAFTVLDDGKPQRLASFEEITVADAPRAWPKPQPGVFTNSAVTPQTARVTIFLLDLLNTPFVNQSDAREALVRFLKALPEVHDPLMLLVMSPNGLRTVHGLTGDPAQLIAAVQRVRGVVSDRESNDTARAKDNAQLAADQLEAFGHGDAAALAQTFSEMETYEKTARDIDRKRTSMTWLQQLAHALAGVPGRKSLIWIVSSAGIATEMSGEISSSRNACPGGRCPAGVPQGQAASIDATRAAQINKLMDETWQAFSDANVVVYPVELEEAEVPGLIAPNLQAPPQTRMQGGSALPSTPSESARRSLTITGITQITGGTYCPLEPKLETCIRKDVEDSNQYYLLSYYADAHTKPGWHKLQVKVAAPGAQVRARSGYSLHGAGEPERERNAEIEQALEAPLDYAGIPLAMFWLSRGAKRQFELAAPPTAFSFTGDQQNHIHLTVTAVAADANGKAASTFSKDIEANLQPQNLARMRSEGLLFRDVMDVPAEASVVRFVLRDEISGRMGSVTAKLK